MTSLLERLAPDVVFYGDSGGKGETAINQAEAVALMQEKFEICTAFFHGFDRNAWTAGGATAKLALLPAAQEHILKQDDGKTRFVKAVDPCQRGWPHVANAVRRGQRGDVQEDA